MKKLIAFVAALFAAAASYGQSPELMSFYERLQAENERIVSAANSDDWASLENIYMEVIALYGQQSAGVRKEARAMMGSVWYNVACLRALRGDKAGALDALEQAVNHGWRDAAFTGNDPDLASLHGEARFGELVAAMK